jgi:hypothetical protein
MTPDVVILGTTRGGRDSDQFYHVITVDLADRLDPVDPWSDLADLENSNDTRILVGYLDTEAEARRWCLVHRYVAEDELMEAPGY